MRRRRTSRRSGAAGVRSGVEAGQRLDHAQALCGRRGKRFTPLRSAVLALLYREDRPLGAYDIVDRLSRSLGRVVSPVSVYRALAFLDTEHLVSRLADHNAYVACQDPEVPHTCVFFLCSRCGGVTEQRVPALDRAILAAARAAGFASRSGSIQIKGLCAQCEG